MPPESKVATPVYAQSHWMLDGGVPDARYQLVFIAEPSGRSTEAILQGPALFVGQSWSRVDERWFSYLGKREPCLFVTLGKTAWPEAPAIEEGNLPQFYKVEAVPAGTQAWFLESFWSEFEDDFDFSKSQRLVVGSSRFRRYGEVLFRDRHLRATLASFYQSRQLSYLSLPNIIDPSRRQDAVEFLVRHTVPLIAPFLYDQIVVPRRVHRLHEELRVLEEAHRQAVRENLEAIEQTFQRFRPVSRMLSLPGDAFKDTAKQIMEDYFHIQVTDLDTDRMDADKYMDLLLYRDGEGMLTECRARATGAARIPDLQEIESKTEGEKRLGTSFISRLFLFNHSYERPLDERQRIAAFSARVVEEAAEDLALLSGVELWRFVEALTEAQIDEDDFWKAIRTPGVVTLERILEQKPRDQ